MSIFFPQVVDDEAQVRNLNETMAKKDVEFARERLIFEACQPQQARRVPDEYMRGIAS